MSLPEVEEGQLHSASDLRKKDRPAIICGAPLSADETQYTVIILGVPRGGTTMVAGVAQRCGLNIGQNLPGNLEDPDFVDSTVAEIRKTIEERNNHFDIWGWKYPRASKYLPKIRENLRNPRIIAVWRDIVATSGRKIAKFDESFSALFSAQRMQGKNLQILSSMNCPVLVASYERATRSPLAFAQIVAEFLSLRLPDDHDELVRFMSPGSYKPTVGQDVS